MDLALRRELVQFIDIGMEYPVHKADARAFVRILIGQLNMDFPETPLERSLAMLAVYSIE